MKQKCLATASHLNQNQPRLRKTLTDYPMVQEVPVLPCQLTELPSLRKLRRAPPSIESEPKRRRSQKMRILLTPAALQATVLRSTLRLTVLRSTLRLTTVLKKIMTMTTTVTILISPTIRTLITEEVVEVGPIRALAEGFTRLEQNREEGMGFLIPNLLKMDLFQSMAMKTDGPTIEGKETELLVRRRGHSLRKLTRRPIVVTLTLTELVITLETTGEVEQRVERRHLH